MIPGWILLLVSVGYVGLLFGVAWLGDRKPLYPRRNWLRPIVYSLALAVYCSSWTFYGAVGTAATTGLGFLPIYLGPILLFLFGWRILERLVLVAREQSTVSIADFLAARYGRAQNIAATVTLIAVIAAIPYIALQFKAVAMSIDVLSGTVADPAVARHPLTDPALYVALLLALFAILFGTREIDATEHHHGMILAVALESLVKLVAFVAVGVFALGHLPGSEDLLSRFQSATRDFVAPGIPQGFMAQTLLAFVAIVCLPRQFHVAVVECGEVADVRRARWLFSAYLLVICVFVLPITSAGQALFAGAGVAPDTYVLALPLAMDNTSLALAAYVGGFSAATGMVIVASVALATMVSNDLVMPAILRGNLARDLHSPHLGARVLWVRRIAIVAIALLAYAYYRGAGESGSLAAFGLLAFAAVGQFAPALIGGLYWRGASRRGVVAGLVAGFVLWGYTLLLPTLTRAGWFDTAWLHLGPLGIAWLQPESLFGLRGWDPITHGTFWSLLVNVLALLVVSARYRPSLEERSRATPFLDPYAQRPRATAGGWQGNLSAADLQQLAAQIQPWMQAPARHRSEWLALAGDMATLGPEVQALSFASNAMISRQMRQQIQTLQVDVKRLSKGHGLKPRVIEPKVVDSSVVTTKGRPGRKVLFTAERLKTQRTRLGFTQEQMAKLLGVSSLSIWKWESGGAAPRASRVTQLLQRLALGKREALALVDAATS